MMVIDPREQTYADMKHLIRRVCREFQAKYGGDIEDLMSTGNEAFVVAYNTHDPDVASFTTWVWSRVWNTLFFEFVDSRRAQDRMPRAGEPVEQVAERPEEGILMAMESLSEDAGTVLRLVLDPPPALAEEVAERGGFCTNWRRSLKKYLRGLGWTMARIVDSFAEVREAQ